MSAWPCCANCRRIKSCVWSISSAAGRPRARLRQGEEEKALRQASKSARQRAARRALGSEPGEAQPAGDGPPGTIVEEFGLFRNVPRAMKTEIARYLRQREADPDWFDGSVLIARKAMKRLYALLHIRPGERAQKNSVREGSARGKPAVRDARAWRRPTSAGGTGPGDRRAADSVSRRRHGGSANDAHGAGGADRIR